MPSTRVGPKQLQLKAAPATPTDLIAVDCWVQTIVLANTGGTARQVVILDKATSPNTIVHDLVAANDTVVFNFNEPVYFEGGINSTGAHAELKQTITGTSKDS